MQMKFILLISVVGIPAQVVHVPGGMQPIKRVRFGKTKEVTLYMPSENNTFEYASHLCQLDGAWIISKTYMEEHSTDIYRLVDLPDNECVWTNEERGSSTTNRVNRMKFRDCNAKSKRYIVCIRSEEKSCAHTYIPARTRNMAYHFPNTSVGSDTYSIDICNCSGKPFANIKCEFEDHFFHPKFDLRTMREFRCDEVGDDASPCVPSPTFPPKTTIPMIPTTQMDKSMDASKFVSLAHGIVTVTESVMQNIVDLVSDINLVSAGEAGKKTSDKKVDKFLVVKALERISERIETEPNKTVFAESKSVTLQISPLAGNGLIKFPAPPTEEKNKSAGSVTANIKVHFEPEFGEGNATNVEPSTKQKPDRCVFINFVGSDLFPEDDEVDKPEQVLNVRLPVKGNATYKVEIDFEIKISPKKNGTIRYYRCGYLRTDIGKWAYDGCKTIPGTPPKCICEHLTNFAVLVQTTNIPRHYTLSMFGTVGCAVSSFGLFLTFLILSLSKKLRQKLSTKLHLHLVGNLFVVYVTFLSGVESTKVYEPCVIIAALIHFSLMASWGWMMVECYAMYKKFVTVLYRPSRRFITNASILTYGISSCIVGTTLGLTVGWKDLQSRGWQSDNDSIA